RTVPRAAPRRARGRDPAADQHGRLRRAPPAGHLVAVTEEEPAKIQADTGRCIAAGMFVMTVTEVIDPSEEDSTVDGHDPDPPGGHLVAVTEEEPVKIKADTGRCIGAGMCVMTLPEVFDQSEEDGTVVVLAPDPPGELHALVRRAVTLCPSGALSLEETPVSSSNSTG